MKRVHCSALVGLVIAGVAGTLASAQPAKESAKPAEKPAAAQPAGMPEMTPEEQAMYEAWMKAATPGPMHEHLLKGAGTWEGTMKMWHKPGTEPEVSTCKSVLTPTMDGRYIKNQTTGQSAMGEFHGFGLVGFDNVSGKFQNVWIDNWGTGMMTGTGELSEDGKTLTWTMQYNCPITHQPLVMREIERYTGPDSLVLEFFGPDMEGNEFKMMEISYKRTSRSAGEAAASKH